MPTQLIYAGLVPPPPDQPGRLPVSFAADRVFRDGANVRFEFALPVGTDDDLPVRVVARGYSEDVTGLTEEGLAALAPVPGAEAATAITRTGRFFGRLPGEGVNSVVVEAEYAV